MNICSIVVDTISWLCGSVMNWWAGKSELHRLISNSHGPQQGYSMHTPQMTVAFSKYIIKYHKNIYTRLKDIDCSSNGRSGISSSNSEVQALVADMLDLPSSGLPRDSNIVLSNLTLCIQSISNVHSVSTKLRTLQLTVFDWNNAYHYRLIDELFANCLPDVHRKEMHACKDWTDIGFQGEQLKPYVILCL